MTGELAAPPRRPAWVAILLLVASLASLGLVAVKRAYRVPGVRDMGGEPRVVVEERFEGGVRGTFRALTEDERRSHSISRAADVAQTLSAVAMLGAVFAHAWFTTPRPKRPDLARTLWLGGVVALLLPGIAGVRVYSRHVENGGASLGADLTWLAVSLVPVAALFVAALMLRRSEPTMSEQVSDS